MYCVLYSECPLREVPLHTTSYHLQSLFQYYDYTCHYILLQIFGVKYSYIYYCGSSEFYDNHEYFCHEIFLTAAYTVQDLN